MNNSMCSNRSSFTNTFSNFTKINPFNPRKTTKETYIASKKNILFQIQTVNLGKK